MGERFEAGRMGTYTIEKDPTRDAGLRVLMGPFKVYDASNVEAEAGPQADSRRCAGGGRAGAGTEHGAAAQVPGHPGL